MSKLTRDGTVKLVSPDQILRRERDRKKCVFVCYHFFSEEPLWEGQLVRNLENKNRKRSLLFVSEKP